jgi:glycosyltransferase involved in cell wall biosynthesis
MRVWLIKTGEPLPCDGPSARLMRTGQIATLLAHRGHDVVWWSAEFDHIAKVKRPVGDRYAVEPRLELHLLRGVPYKKNVSIARLVNHAQMSADFTRRAAAEPRPDVILCSLPTVDLAASAATYARKHSVPLVLDMRDKWPEAIVELFPPRLHPLARLALSPMERSLKRTAATATAIFGITPQFVEWGASHAGRAVSPLDRCFPQGYAARPPSDHALAEAHAFWDSHRVPRDGFNAIYIGALGHQTRAHVRTAIDAARALADDPRFKVVIAGAGEQLPNHRVHAASLPNVVLPGWIDGAQIWALRERARVGLVLYDSNANMSAGWPNKSIEYLAGGLPIVSNLKGALASLIADNDIGVHLDDCNAATLAATLRALAADPARLATLAQRARSLYEARFVGERVYAELADHLERIARPGRAVGRERDLTT